MSNAKTSKLGVPDFPPSSHKNRKNENNYYGEESLRSRDPRFNPDELDSHVKLKKSQYCDESQLSSEQESPNRIKIPSIKKKKKQTSPQKRQISRKRSPSLDLELDISDERASSNQENSEFNKV